MGFGLWGKNNLPPPGKTALFEFFKTLFKQDYELMILRNSYLRADKHFLLMIVFLSSFSLGIFGAVLLDVLFPHGYIWGQLFLCVLCTFIVFGLFLGRRKYYLKKYGVNAYSYAFIRLGLPGVTLENVAFFHLLLMGGGRLVPLVISLPLAVIFFSFAVILVKRLFLVLGYYNMTYISHYYPKKGFISSGLFSIIKHPNLLAAWLIAIAFALVRSTFYSFIGALIMIIMNVVWGWFEERELIQRTKGEYSMYKRKVPGFIPRISDIPRFFSLVTGKKFRSVQKDVVLFYFDNQVLYHSDAFLRPRVPAPLGLLYIATILEDYGYKVEFVDARLPGFSLSEFLRSLALSKPKIVGFYSLADYRQKTCDLMGKVKKLYPNMKTLLGGPAVRDDCILAESDCDVLVRSEGEYTALELADCFVKGKGRLEDIKGISYKNSENEIKRNPDRPVVDDLDSLPIPRRDFLKERSKYYSSSIMSSRGCPYECIFCSEARCEDRYFRMRSAENVMEEVRMLVNNDGENFVGFMDDTFIVSTERVKKLCEYFKKEMPKDFVWWCEGRANILAQDLDLIRAMKEAGVVCIQIGIESGNQKTLDAYKKSATLEQIEKVVKKCAEEEVMVYGNFILGGPFETEETVNDSINFACKLIDLAPGYLSTTLSFLAPFPQTELVMNSDKYGIRVLDPALKKGQSMYYCATETEGLNREKMVEMHEKFMRIVYGKLFGQLKKLSKKIVDKNFAVEQYGWRNINTVSFRSNQIISMYYDKRNISSCRYFSEIGKGGLWDLYPTRVLPPIAYKEGGKILVSNGIKNITLDGLEAAIYEFSSGKISFRSVIDEVSGTEEGNNLSSDQILQRALKLYRVLDNNWLIVFHEF